MSEQHGKPVEWIEMVLRWIRGHQYDEAATIVALDHARDAAIALQTAYDTLADEHAKLQWRRITPEDLPKVGDEMLSAGGEYPAGGSNEWWVSEYDAEDGINAFGKDWTYFRPINPPTDALIQARAQGKE